MLKYLWDLGGHVIKMTGSLDRTQWIFVFVGVVIIGVVCMRGFGSRKNY